MMEKLPTAAAKGLAEGDTCNITVTGGQTEAGTYTAQVAAIDNANYKLPAETTVTFVIRKADFELTGMPQAKTDLVYDGKEQELITAGSARVALCSTNWAMASGQKKSRPQYMQEPMMYLIKLQVTAIIMI